MKFTLLVVGRTVEKHYITAINDYVERTRHFISFDMEVIPELKNTKNLKIHWISFWMRIKNLVIHGLIKRICHLIRLMKLLEWKIIICLI